MLPILVSSTRSAAPIPSARRKRFSFDSSRKLVLLAPSAASIPFSFRQVESDPLTYGRLLRGMQKLRGSVYLEDGAVRPHELQHGAHCLPCDEHSWQILVLGSEGEVSGCARYREHSNEAAFSELGVSAAEIARCLIWGESVKSRVEHELALSRRLEMPYVELGGWALTEQLRGTTEALRMALATYALAQALGGGVGIATATHRNGSASILRRIGGLSLESRGQEIPTYFDPRYRCEMEVLRFYSWAPNLRYAKWIADLRAEIQSLPVVTNGRFDTSWKFRRTLLPHLWHDATVSQQNSRSSFV